MTKGWSYFYSNIQVIDDSLEFTKMQDINSFVAKQALVIGIKTRFIEKRSIEGAERNFVHC